MKFFELTHILHFISPSSSTVFLPQVLQAMYHGSCLLFNSTILISICHIYIVYIYILSIFLANKNEHILKTFTCFVAKVRFASSSCIVVFSYLSFTKLISLDLFANVSTSLLLIFSLHHIFQKYME